MQKIQIKIPSLMENIRIVESFIDNAKEKFNINDDLYGNIMIAVTESVNNAIQHGNKYDKNKNVNLCLDVMNDKIKFTIEDEGPGFEYHSLPDPTSPENIEKVNGRGIFLMQQLSDKIEFFDMGRKVELEFKMPTG